MDILLAAPLGNFDMKDGGYGNAAEGILSVLTKMKEDEDCDIVKNVDHVSTLNISTIELPNKKYDIVILLTHPNSFLNPHVNTIFRNILSLAEKRFLSIVWETQPLPKNWNWLWTSDLFTGFLVPSYFVGKQIASCTNKPVYYNPHYIDINYFKSIDIEKKKNESKFSVLFMGQYTERKSIRESLISFIRAMHPHKDTQLILKYHNMGSNNIPLNVLIKNYILSNCSLPSWKSSIFELTDNLSKDEVVKLYRNCSLLLFPSKGEGFGLPIAEAMSVGIPVIYTNWSSCPEVGKAKGNIPVDYFLDESFGMNAHGYEYGDEYAYPKLRSLTDAIREKYNLWRNNKENYYLEVSNNRNIINEKFGYNKIKKYLENILMNKMEERIKI